MIASLLSVFARSEAVYDRQFVPLRGKGGVSHQGSRKGHRLRPTGRSVSGTWMHLQYECYLLLLGHGWSGNGMLSSMTVVIVSAWMFW